MMNGIGNTEYKSLFLLNNEIKQKHTFKDC
jgi:hypothetical protein